MECVVCGVWCVVVQMTNDTACQSRRVREMHLIRVAGTPGSKLPASPPPLPRPDGGGTPGRVPVYTAQKTSQKKL